MTKIKYGLFGRTLKHSLSAVMHQTAFDHFGIDAQYELIEIDPGDFNQRISTIKNMGYAGFNITIPYKQAIMANLDELSIEAGEVGAVNTIKVEGNKWTGYNTDISGFMQPLYKLGREFTKVLVLGNGGAALAVIYAIQKIIQPEKTIICARNQDRTHEIMKKYGTGRIQSESFEKAVQWLAQSDLIINTTPLGMSPDIESTALPEISGLKRDAVVYDLVYNPYETRMLSEIRIKYPGITRINGLPMLVGQAAEAFRIWTGREFPEDMVYQKLKAKY